MCVHDVITKMAAARSQVSVDGPVLLEVLHLRGAQFVATGLEQSCRTAP